MTTITLTEKHKEKLIEMCKALFPEYKYWHLHSGSCDLCTENTLDFAKDVMPRWNSWNRVHWFEFVMTHLTDIMYKNIWKQMRKNNKLFDVITKEGFYTQVLHHKCDIIKHPVDYLYEQFKKLN